MSSAALLLVSIAFAAQSPIQPVTRPAGASPCAQVSADALTDVAVGEICAGDDAARSTVAPFDSAARTRSWRVAAEHYRRASTLSSKLTTKVVALNALANIYDSAYLDDVTQLEGALRELIALKPEDMSPMYRLARLQEDRGLVDAAEDTLLIARRQQPDAVEPYTALAAFYTRRATARRRATEIAQQAANQQPDAAYRVGGDVRPPTKISDIKPTYPPEALAAGIGGVVILEVVINESGSVINPRVLRSIPALDRAALDAVSQWQFTPTRMNGQPVPVIMTVTVNFEGPPPAPLATPPRP